MVVQYSVTHSMCISGSLKTFFKIKGVKNVALNKLFGIDKLVSHNKSTKYLVSYSSYVKTV